MHKNLVGPLKEKGFIVEQAFNGQEGVETALSTKPDLVICDIEMPVMNGLKPVQKSEIKGYSRLLYYMSST
ncbi:MAG: hypothetical protein CM15mP85_15380 [Rhodobacterales bacterium]|nr:MAG: hypothetical protein CM15mP85_15380 [Rhodobacterales bacterium]